ncbi:hypothetical protein B0T10DRAFT_102967 [Thelonectria olida]|uniref:Uncharacterized protein n=1 Tax=Thelonectria olida TaxID=1576542 RepID=A0A9P8WFS8_9HYPO|nr:hypothetical protein B0T10DRAFT_102967 [Thelonectria olida]
MEKTTAPPPQQQQRPLDQQRQQQPISQYQPVYQQYQPFPPQGQAMRTVLASPRGMWSSKLTLRIFSIVFSLIIIGVAAGVAIYDLLPIVEFCPPAGLAFIWNVAESICICVRGGHRGIAPGAVVALDLLIWLGYLAAVVFHGIWGISDYYYEYGYESGNEFSEGHGSAYGRALFSFGIMEILIHIALFIIACYETHDRNKRTQVVYVQPGTEFAAMYPPPNFQMPQVYQQPIYSQPFQQQHLSGYYAPLPQDQTKKNMQPAFAPVQPVHHQPSTQAE